jgi:uncharacterized membrane protein
MSNNAGDDEAVKPSDAANSQDPTDSASSNYDPKVIAIVSYVTLIGWIVAVVMNNPKSPFASFHIRQSLAIMLLFVASGIITVIPVLGWLIGLLGYLTAFVLWIIGLIASIQGSKNAVPLIGEKSQEWFKAL